MLLAGSDPFAGARQVGSYICAIPPSAKTSPPVMKLLSCEVRKLKEQVADGIVTRTDHKEVPPRVDYDLTPLGRSLAEALVPLCSWGTQNMAEVARVFAQREGWRCEPQVAAKFTPGDVPR